MAKALGWISTAVVGAGLLASCQQGQSQAFRPVPEPTPLPSGAPYRTEPALPQDLALVPKVDETRLPGGGAERTIPLFAGVADTGTGTAQPVQFYVLAMDDQRRSTATSPSSYFNRPTALWQFYRANGEPVQGQAPIFSAVPGEAGYLPYFQIHRVTVPDGYVANQLRDHRNVLRALGTVDSGYQETVLPVAMNLPIVAEHAQLQGAETARPAQGWYMGRRAYYFTFDTQPVKANGTVDVSTMWAIGPELGKQPGNYDPARALPRLLPFLNQIGANAVQTATLIDVLPSPVQSTPESPETTAYGGIKAVVNVPQAETFPGLSSKAAIANLAGLPPAKVWLNAPLRDTLRP